VSYEIWQPGKATSSYLDEGGLGSDKNSLLLLLVFMGAEVFALPFGYLEAMIVYL
jgi:hypothetical protein